MGLPISRLCLADKLAFALAPAWLYLPMAQWTGELDEYMMRSRERQAGDSAFTAEEARLIRSAKPLWLGVAWAPNVAVTLNGEVLDAAGGTESYRVTARGLTKLAP